MTVMHLSMFPPEAAGGDTLGIWQPVTTPRNLTDDFGTGAGPKMSQLENLEEIMSKFEGTSSGF